MSAQSGSKTEEAGEERSEVSVYSKQEIPRFFFPPNGIVLLSSLVVKCKEWKSVFSVENKE